eukprot:COSAG01_NODE_1449_length_10271_cov_6.347976_3_plen_113_part_00
MGPLLAPYSYGRLLVKRCIYFKPGNIPFKSILFISFIIVIKLSWPPSCCIIRGSLRNSVSIESAVHACVAATLHRTQGCAHAFLQLRHHLLRISLHLLLLPIGTPVSKHRAY